MRVLLLRPSAPDGSARYSGGVHGLRCVAETLAAAGVDVHLLYAATKAEMMCAAMLRGALPAVGYSAAVEGVATWPDGAITHHVSLLDAQPSMQDALSSALAGLACSSSSSSGGGSSGSRGPGLAGHLLRLVDEAAALLAASSPQQQTWVLLDADGSQTPAGATLMEACSAALGPGRLLLLVQNIHFLPLGPAGTAPRCPALLQAWRQLGGVVCVSEFVARYVAQHVAPLGLQASQLHVAHYATWRAFGSGPFADLGPAAARRLAAWRSAVTSGGGGGGASAGSSERPVIGCLKLTPEKGGSLFLALARQLPELNFLGVCADPALLAAAGGLANVRLVAPVEDVEQLLAHMTLLVAPSCWQEAYGMAVTDAVLRGLPVIVSNQGGLQEAALGQAAAVVPVAQLLLPADADSGSPCWSRRQVPDEQPVWRWAEAIQQLLGSQAHFEERCRAGRQAGVQLLQRQPEMLRAFEAWLTQLAQAQG